jgi:hypothetical protein
VGARYRLEQFWRNFHAVPLTVDAQREIQQRLSLQEVALFERFGFEDQWHSYRVYCTLLEDGESPELLVAALLHDVGKTCSPLSIWDRTLVVLAEATIPGRVARWGTGSPRGWRRPFVVRAQHAAWGAQMAREAGSSPSAVSLIRRHQEVLPAPAAAEEPELRQLRKLQWADNQH